MKTVAGRLTTRQTRIWVFILLVLFTFMAGCNYGIRKEEQKGSSPDWSKLGPGGGGSTFIPAFSFFNPEKFLIRCDMTGSYLTTDGGNSYQQINFPNGAQSFAYDPKDSGIIYIGSAVLNRSGDNGKTWEQIFPKPEEITAAFHKGDHAMYSIRTIPNSLYDPDAGSIDNIRVDPVNNAFVYFSMGRSFFYPENPGKTFQRKDLRAPIDFIYTNTESLQGDVLIFTSHKMYSFNKSSKAFKEKELPAGMVPAASFTGGRINQEGQIIFYALHDLVPKDASEEFRETELWMSEDLGETWARTEDKVLNNLKDGFKPSYSMVAAAELDAKKAYIVCDRYLEKQGEENVHWYGALKTGDGGKSWEWVWKGGGGSGTYGVKDGSDALNLEDAWVKDAFGGEYIRLLDAGVYPNDGNVAIVTDWYRTMKTVDGGNSWREVYSEKQPDNSFISRGMDVTTAYGVHQDPFDKDHLAISYTDIGYHHSFNGGKSWVRSTAGVPPEWQNTCYWMVFDPEVKNKIWSVWSSLHDFPRGKMTRNSNWKDRARGGVCVSSDGGKTWSPANKGMGDAATTSIVLDRNSKKGERTLYASVYNKGVFKSVDDGKTWMLKNNGIGENTAAFELTIQDNGNLFLIVSPVPKHEAGKSGREYLKGEVYKSEDGAESWSKLSISDNPVIFPNGLDYDPKDPKRIYLACWSDIYLSDLIGGKVSEETGGNELLKSEGGIFMSADGGKTWESIFDPIYYVYDVTVDTHHEGRLYCNTFNNAAYRSDDFGETWKKLKDYDFHWGHRVIMDDHDHSKVYLTTFGSSVLHGSPVVK